MISFNKRIAYGIFGAMFGAGTTYIAMLMIGKVNKFPIIVVAGLCFFAAFFGGKKAFDAILKLEDYLD